jgi:hypothetical protein
MVRVLVTSSCQFAREGLCESPWQAYQPSPSSWASVSPMSGAYWCTSRHNRAIGVSTTAMGVSPVVAQWALADLCPNGCHPPEGCSRYR